MARHSISEASKLTGKARSTLHNHIKDGTLSKGLDDNGKPYIETAELERVYGPLQSNTVQQDSPNRQPATPNLDTENRVLQAEIDALHERLSDRDEVITDLRARLDRESEERRKLTALLTDLRRPDPAPEPSPSTTSIPGTEKPRESFRARLGRLIAGKSF